MTEHPERRAEALPDEELVAAARRLGIQAAGRLDLERTARGVVARWRAGQRRVVRPIWRSPSFLRLVAAMVLLFVGLETWENRLLPPTRVIVVEPNDAGLEGLTTQQLESFLSAVGRQPSIQATAADAGLEGLTPDELESVLATMGS